MRQRIDPVEHARLQNETAAQKTEIESLQNKILEVSEKMTKAEEQMKNIENKLSEYNSLLSEKSIEVLEKDGLISKMKEELLSLKNSSKVAELVINNMIISKEQEIEKMKLDRQTLVQRSNENVNKARQRNADLNHRNKELEKQISEIKVLLIFRNIKFIENA